MGVNRSVIFRCSLAPRNALRAVKFVVSTTSVLPSYQPRASPRSRCRRSLRWGRCWPPRADRIDVAADPAAQAGRPLLRALSCLVGQRRHRAVGRVDNEPRRAVPAIEGIEDQVRRRAQAAGELRPRHTGVELLGAPLVGLGEFGGRDVLDPPSGELGRPLERHPRLVVVAVDAGDLRITPGRPRGSIGRAPELLAGLRGLLRRHWRGRAGHQCRGGETRDRQCAHLPLPQNFATSATAVIVSVV
jgi:hypothetical protein